jgi:SAM-dependent methyltransferase
LQEGVIVRNLRRNIVDADFLRSDLARRWAADGRIVPFQEMDAQRIQAPRLPFVTQPDEWCDAQLWTAGDLTLQLQVEAVEAGFDLKDASAWNVIFDGVRPVMCDHMSPTPLTARKWWAAGQFSRHFLLPLLVSRRRGLRGHQSFAVWRDGLPAACAARLIGPARYLSRYWPLMAEAAESAQTGAHAGETPAVMDQARIRRFRAGLHASLRWMLDGVAARTSPATSTWSDYTDQRHHYAEQSIQLKRSQVASWLESLGPKWVADLGCNNGEFSQLALAAGASVVAVDGDHDAVQAMFRGGSDASRLYPVLAQLDDLSMGRGWAGREHQALGQRLLGRFDMVMMLALIHHLAIGAAIPLAEVAKFAASLTRDWLIIEFVDSDDVQLRRLCAQRGRAPEDFSAGRQRQAFVDAGFVVQGSLTLDPAPRQLVLMRLAR